MKKLTRKDLLNLVDKLSFDEYFKVKIKEAISHFDKVWDFREHDGGTYEIKNWDIVQKGYIYKFHLNLEKENVNVSGITSEIISYVDMKNRYTKTYACVNSFEDYNKEDYLILKQIVSHIKTKTVEW
jgi:hypothetical protein